MHSFSLTVTHLQAHSALTRDLRLPTCGLRSNKWATKRGLGFGLTLPMNPGSRQTRSTPERHSPLSQLGQPLKIIGRAPRSKPTSIAFANIFIATLQNNLPSIE